MDQLRESFVFHFEYIADIPEELQSTYAMYAIKYAQFGIEPELTDWRDVRMWNKTKTRIDSDALAWEETRSKRSDAGKKHKGNQYTSKENGTNWNKMEQCSICSNEMEHDGTNGTVSVYVSDNVSVSESVSVSVDDAPKAQALPDFPQSLIDDWFESHSIRMTQTQRSRILTRLNDLDFYAYPKAKAFLDYAFDFTAAKYAKVSGALITSAVCDWENVLQNFKAVPQVKDKAKKIKPPKNCPVCNQKLIWINNFLYFCGNCKKDIKQIGDSWEVQ